VNNYIPPRARQLKSAVSKSPASVANPALERVLNTFREHLHIPDTGPIEILLGAYAANVLPGDPVWLILVGPPSSGKGELLGSLGGLPYLHAAATLTEAALLSGVKSGDRADDASGGLLREMGDFGILLLKDFTSILSMSRETRAAMLAALREIFDGNWTRRLGVDGGRCLSWRGKMGLLGGVTQALDSHHAVMAEMGPRFVLYRLPPVDGQRQARRALANSGREAEARIELCDSVKCFFAGLDLSTRQYDRGTAEETTALVLLTEFVSHCRSAIERHPYSREITQVFEPEAPARLVRSGAQLLAGLDAIGVDSRRALQLVTKVLKDCIPPVRRSVLDYLTQTIHAPGSILESTGLPKQTIRTALEDLRCHGIVTHDPTLGWEIARRWREHLAIAYPGSVCRAARLGGRISALGDSE
jgi:hypothetical protein